VREYFVGYALYPEEEEEEEEEGLDKLLFSKKFMPLILVPTCKNNYIYMYLFLCNCVCLLDIMIYGLRR
jgi:hypothetical protein